MGDGHTGEELVQLFVVPHSQLEMTGDDPCLLVVTGSVAGQLEDLSCQVFHDGSQVHGGSGSYALGVVALPEETVNSANRELKTGTARSGFCLCSGFASFATSRHVEKVDSVETTNCCRFCRDKLKSLVGTLTYILSRRGLPDKLQPMRRRENGAL